MCGTSEKDGQILGFGGRTETRTSSGRWPANVVLDESQAAALDQMSGFRRPGERPASAGITSTPGANGTMGAGWSGSRQECREVLDAGGGASRFFYVAKAPKSERPSYAAEGPIGDDATSISTGMKVRSCKVCGSRGKPAGGEHSGKPWPTCGHDDWEMVAPKPAAEHRVAHPTVKPLALMRWLVRLVTPPGGTVLEPFAGSGTTVEACLLEGFHCIAIEREADYLPLIEARIARVGAATVEREPDLFDLDGVGA